jgi:putative nucleotidyltransferase with HDIG domain
VRQVNTRQLQTGTRLARSIYSENGNVLLGKGVELSERIIRRLISMEVPMVFIEDKDTEGIEPQDILSEETRRIAVNTVHETMKKLMNESNMHQVMVAPDLGKKFREVIKSVLTEIQSQKDVMLGLSNIYTKDGYLYHHSVNVAITCLAMGTSLGLNQLQLIDLGVGAILHDIGKTRIPLGILNKPGELTLEEWEVIYEHPQLGFDILRNSYDISLLSAHIALQHHEKEDGTGYPRKISGEKIHFYGKIAAIADVYEALTAARSYKRALPPHEAVEYIMGNGGRHFNFELVQVFCKHMAPYPVGTSIRLSSGERAIVVKVNANYPQRPLIRVIENESGERLKSPYEVDLLTELTTIITGVPESMEETG